MHRKFLLNLLRAHTTTDPTEENMRINMIRFVEEHENCFDRSLLVGHITGSAWVVNREMTHVFFTHHKKLDRWLQPGGHSDGDANTLAVAMREASEESGIEDVYIQPVTTDSIFDVDIHTIPARKNEPEHAHYDVRFLLEADMHQPLKITEESNEIAWIPVEEIEGLCNGDESIIRMLNKMKNISSSHN